MSRSRRVECGDGSRGGHRRSFDKERDYAPFARQKVAALLARIGLDVVTAVDVGSSCLEPDVSRFFRLNLSLQILFADPHETTCLGAPVEVEGNEQAGNDGE